MGNKKGVGHASRSSQTAEILKRRIASLWIRGMVPYEIIQMLSEPERPGPDGFPTRNPSYLLNPRTGKPYGKSTVYRIMDVLKEEWKRKDAEKISEHYATIISTHTELLRASWASGDREMVLATVNSLAKLVGANAPLKAQVANFNPKDLTNEQLERIVNGEPIEQVLLGRGADLPS